MMFSTPLQAILWLWIAASSAAPVDEPIRVDLPVYDQPQLGSDVQLAMAVEPESVGEDRSGHSLVGGLLAHKLHAATGLLEHKIHANQIKANAVHGGFFAPPVTSLEGALLETEGYGSKALSVKDNLHHIVAGIFQPKPIVDTIREEEKFGNSGDKFYSAGRAIVGGAEGVSNLVNSVLEVPGNIIKKITRIATEKLNNLGGKLIGL